MLGLNVFRTFGEVKDVSDVAAVGIRSFGFDHDVGSACELAQYVVACVLTNRCVFVGRVHDR